MNRLQIPSNLEAKLARLIKLESAGKQRTQLLKLLCLATRELAQKTPHDADFLDLLAFTILTLEAIQATIEPSIQAWEKRGYWVKADQFRRDWSWTGRCSADMRTALAQNDWQALFSIVENIRERVRHINIPQHHRMGTPWIGAWKRYRGRSA